jgi:hypothetical protein
MHNGFATEKPLCQNRIFVSRDHQELLNLSFINPIDFRRTIPMKIRLTLWGCALLAALFLSGCSTSKMLDSASKGKTYEQLVEEMRPVKTERHAWLGDGRLYSCWTCANGPTWIYTNKAGNEVAVYSFRAGYDYPSYCSGNAYSASCQPAYAQCHVLEKRFEFLNKVVIRAWEVYGSGPKNPPYTQVCSQLDSMVDDWNRGR